MTHKTIAVIGGGASATLLLAHLARQPQNDALHIDVYDQAGAFARGIAYSSPHLCHLLNVRAANMSALADAPDHFAQWAASHGYQPSDFVPRKLYGDYLDEHVQQAGTQLPLSLIHASATSMRDGNGYTVNGKRYDVVVQATGNCRPLRPAMTQPVDGYYDSPWCVDYAQLRHQKTVVLIGSGLSAVDAILALHAHDYAGEIIVLSRRAQFPGVHVLAPAHPAFLTQLPATAVGALHAIRQEIKRTDAPWQTVIDSLRPYTNTIWTHWSADQRQRFRRRLLTIWNIHRHRMAPQIADTLEMLERSGQVRRASASVQRVEAGPVVQTNIGAFPADSVINCLGYRYEAPDVASTHQIGPACFGPLFETTAIPEIRSQAAHLAPRICL